MHLETLWNFSPIYEYFCNFKLHFDPEQIEKSIQQKTPLAYKLELFKLVKGNLLSAKNTRQSNLLRSPKHRRIKAMPRTLARAQIQKVTVKEK